MVLSRKTVRRNAGQGLLFRLAAACGKQVFYAVLAVLILVPAALNAEIYPAPDGLNWYYKIVGDKVTIINDGDNPRFSSAIDPKQAVGVVSVPAVIDGKTVSEIGANSFSSCSNLVSLILPEGVKVIGERAFEGCSALEDVTFPSTITKLERYAFNGCDELTNLIVNASRPLSIGDHALAGRKKLRDVRISSLSDLTIDSFAFYGCAELTTVCIAATNTVTVGDSAFSSCSGCANINISAGDSLIVGNSAFLSCSGCANIDINAGDSLIVGDSAFSSCAWCTNININAGDSLIVGDSAFKGCTKIVSIDLPESTVSIGVESFRNCSSLGAITIPASVEAVGNDAFAYCVALSNVTFATTGDSAPGTHVGSRAFSSCINLLSVSLSTNVVAIGDHSFSGCSKLDEAIVPDSVCTVGEYAYVGCSALTNVQFTACGGGAKTVVGKSAFEGDVKIERVSLSSNVVSLGASAFDSCTAIKDLSMEEGLESIGDMAFYGCESISALLFPSTVTNIGEYAFFECSDVREIVFADDTNVVKCLTIGRIAFMQCSSVTNLYLPECATNIGYSAFQNLGNLSMVTLPTGLQDIAATLFGNCYSLGGVKLPETLTMIGTTAFANGTNLMDFTIPAAVASVGQEAFYNTLWWNLQPDGLVVKDGWLLGVKGEKPSSLTNLAGVVHIADYALANCGGLTNLVIATNVLTVGSHAFDGCTNFVSVEIADSVQLDPEAFLGSNWDPEYGALDSDDYGKFYVVFDANGGYGKMAKQRFIYGTEQALASNAFSRAGWQFDGWSTNSEGGVFFTDGQVVSNLSHRAGEIIPLYAHWTEMFYVTFDANGGEGNMATQSFTYGTAQALASNGFCRTDWQFDGWSTNSEGGVFFMDGQVVSNLSHQAGEVMPLYAHWTERFYVTFDANGGEGNMAAQSFTYGIAQALASNGFSRTDWQFDGWTTNSEAGVLFTEGQVVSNLSCWAGEIVPLYAHWIERFYVTFDANGGEGNMATQSFTYGIAQALASNLYSRTDWLFDGWATNREGGVLFMDGLVVSNFSHQAGEVIPLYAHWAVNYEMQHEECTNGFTWVFMVLSNDTVKIQGVLGDFVSTVTDITIPSSLLEGRPVTAIASNAFSQCTALVSVTAPPSVSVIEPGAFSNCANIVAVNIPMVSPLSSIMPDSYRKIRSATVPGVDDFLDQDIEVCASAFKGCISLSSVSLPLGVKEISDSAFDGCSALASFDMPYTVTSIGDRAFADCSAMTALTVTENVTDIGASAFTGCAKLKIVRYLGDEPNASGGSSENIYYKANGNLVSGYLRGIRDWPSAPSAPVAYSGGGVDDDKDGEGDEESSSGGGTTAAPTIVRWPEGAAGRPLLAWNTSMYSFKKVTFVYNDGKTASKEVLYVKGRVLGDLPEVGDEGFEGWWTAPYGGEGGDAIRYKIVDSAITLYAHWSGDANGGGTRGLVDALGELYDDDRGFAYTAATFDGLLVSDGVVMGTIQVKTKKGKYSASDEGTNSSFSASMQVAGAKKTSLSGRIGSDGVGIAENERKGLSLEIEFSQFGMSGIYSTEDGDYEIVGARDRYSAGSEEAKGRVRTALANARKNWVVVLPTGDADGDGAALAEGNSVLSISVGAKGKAKISGKMADGTKVSASSVLIVGDSCCCLPVVASMYPGKKGGFAFALWFTWSEDASENSVTVEGLSAWDATQNKSAPFYATFGTPVVGVAGTSRVPAAAAFGIDGFFDIAGADSSFSPDGTEIDASSSKWKLPKADSVRFSSDDGWYIVEGKGYGNPAGLKLSYVDKTGMFTGRFSVYAETESGKSKKYTATVSGVVVNGVGYGTATVKKLGSVPVRVE